MNTLIRILLVLTFSSLIVSCASDDTGTDTGGITNPDDRSSDANPDPAPQPSVGIPDQNSTSLSVGTWNIDCWRFDGTTTNINMRLADQLNNNTTIPDGTIVYFATEGGAIPDECSTTAGACTVDWICQDPRPSDGRVSILAWTLGVESFNDNNSNGFYDAGDTMISATDIGEPFLDKNFNFVRDLDEEFVDYPNPSFSSGGTYDGPDGLYSGPNCNFPADPPQCAPDQSVFIFSPFEIVMSDGDSYQIVPVEYSAGDYNPVALAEPIDLSNGGIGSTVLSFLIVDSNGNTMPKDTVVDFAVTDAGKIIGPNSETVTNNVYTAQGGPPWPASTVSALTFNVRIDEERDNDEPKYGYMTISVTPPGKALPPTIINLLDPAGFGGSSSSSSSSGSTSSSGSSSSSSSSSSGGATPDPAPQPSVGIPDQNSMSLSMSSHNVDCWNEDGVTVTVNIRLADQLNNNTTIPNGTIVYFATEGGAIQDECGTTNGACSVPWICQNVRPADGRATVLVWTLGIESFNDNNSNGLFDAGDTRILASDVGEPFIDKNFNGTRDIDEEFVNYPDPGLTAGGGYNFADGLYSGPNCDPATGLCAPDETVFIFQQSEIIMSDGDSPAQITPVQLVGSNYNSVTLTTPIDLNNNVNLSFLFSDANGNPLPTGTSISITASAGTIIGTSSFTVPDNVDNASGGSPWAAGDVSSSVYGVRIDEEPDNAVEATGVLTVTATPPGKGPTEKIYDLLDPIN